MNFFKLHSQMNPHPVTDGGSSPLAKTSFCFLFVCLFSCFPNRETDCGQCVVRIVKEKKSTQQKNKTKNKKLKLMHVYSSLCLCVCVRALVCCPGNAVRWRTVCEGLDLRQTGSQSLSSQQPTSLSTTLAATKEQNVRPTVPLSTPWG